MQDSVKDYIETVKNQVRWKRSHEDIISELQNHIEEQAESYMKEGFSQEGANLRAVQEMGDPIEVGAEFDRVYKPVFRWDLVSFIILFTLGGIALHLTINLYLGMWINFTTAAVSVGLGALLLVAGYKMDFTVFTKYPLTIFFILSTCLAVIVYFWPWQVNGARFFINGRDLSSLFLLYPVIFSGLVCKLRNKGLWGCFICAITYFFIAWLAVAGNRLFLFINITFVCAPIMYYAIHKNWFGSKNFLKALFIGTIIFFIAALVIFFINGRGWYGTRVQAIVAPHKDPFGYGYQNMIIREFFQSSKFIGKSDIGKDISSWLVHIGTDNMFTFVAYRFGILAFLILTGMIVFFLLKAVKQCLKQKSFYGKIFSLTIIGIYAIQFIVYIVNNTWSFIMFANPPFIKYTGVNYLVNMFLFGILLSVFSCEKLFIGAGNMEAEVSDNKFIEMKNKQVIIDFNYFKRKV